VSLIALGVTGGIGAYKAVEVCRGLQKRGHDVVAVMTRSATKFVGPLTFEAITRRPVLTSQWRPGANARPRPEGYTEVSTEPWRSRGDIEHIAIADAIALLVVAPCTANVVGKFANGIADDFLTSLYLATKAPVLLAPAMNSNMLAHEAVQANLQTLAGRGVRFVEPGEGYLACGWIGKGRLAEPADVVEAACGIVDSRAASPSERSGLTRSVLDGTRVLVTAGPTYEDIDAVRFIGNRSSGRMGFALAADARRRGAHVTVVAGPTSVEPPAVDGLIRVRNAAEMYAAVMQEAASADVVIMAAAVADYAPSAAADGKIAKTHAPMTLTLHRTPDILAELGDMRARLGGRRPLLVGFAAETDRVLEKAREKRARKQVDLIVANDVSAGDRGFEAETNAVTIVSASGEIDVPLQSKARVAARILDAVEAELESQKSADKSQKYV
jgi:phosphopantothenoylcysteine decarboxylase / phosphopantothenate---cysteine ligase